MRSLEEVSYLTACISVAGDIKLQSLFSVSDSLIQWCCLKTQVQKNDGEDESQKEREIEWQHHLPLKRFIAHWEVMVRYKSPSVESV